MIISNKAAEKKMIKKVLFFGPLSGSSTLRGMQIIWDKNKILQIIW